MKKALFSAVLLLPAALFAAGMENDRARQLAPIDAGSILAQIEQQQHIQATQPIISSEMQFALESASELRKDLKAQGIKAKVGLLNEPDYSYGLWVEFRNWADYEKIKDLFYQDPGYNPSYRGHKVYPRVPKSAEPKSDYRPDSVLSPLMSAVKDAQRDELDSMGYFFGFTTYPAKTRLTKIYADIVGYSESDIDPSYFTTSQGEASVRAMTRFLKDEAKGAIEGSDDPKDKIIAQKIQGVAAAQEKAFLTPSRFTVQLAAHNRQEDGDMDYRILIAQEKDGSLRVLSYIRNPY